jgi:hypothetical protein
MFKINQLNKRGVKRVREEYYLSENTGASDEEEEDNREIIKKTEFRVKIKPKSFLKKKDVPSYIN